jgi:hypothetical protein
LLLLLGAGVAGAETLSSQVNEAIRLGVEWIEAQQERGGRFRSGYEPDFSGGPTALAVYALAKSGVAPDHPAINEALGSLRANPPERVYSVAALVLALDALGSNEHDARIRDLARWLMRQKSRTEPLWNYGPDTKGENPVDISNTQLAVLGLWAAERHGYRAPGDLWRDLARRVPALQGSEGAFVYRTGFWACGGTTTAGMTVLEVALRGIPKAERSRGWAENAEEALQRGWRFLDENFTVSGNPRAGKDQAWDPAFHHYYYLYGLERVATLGQRERIGGRDWYREGARFLVARQESDGSWGSLENTCFALLFLRRATLTTLHGEQARKLPEQERAEPLPLRSPGARASFIRRWLVLGPFPDPEPARPTPSLPDVAPRSGEEACGGMWRESRTARGSLGLEEAAGVGDRRIVYAFTYLHVRSPVDLVLSVADAGGGTAYLDGREIWSRGERVAPEDAQASVETSLEPGVHRLLLKVSVQGGESGISVRFARRNGTVARDVVPSLSPEDPEPSANALAHPELLSLDQLRARLPVDPDPVLRFGEPRDVLRVAWVGVDARVPEWRQRGGDFADRNPPADGDGIVLVEPPSSSVVGRAIRKVVVPAGALLRVVAGTDAARAGDGADCRLRIGVFDGTLHWLDDRVLSGAEWTTMQAPLDRFVGKEVLVVAEYATAGQRLHESAFLDEMSLVVPE